MFDKKLSKTYSLCHCHYQNNCLAVARFRQARISTVAFLSCPYVLVPICALTSSMRSGISSPATLLSFENVLHVGDDDERPHGACVVARRRGK